MGKVVDLESTAKERQKAARSSQARRAKPQAPKRRSKTALVLGGGGFTGAVYEIGALRALDLLSVNRSVTDFDIFVGTSAGSFVAAMMANGITPEEMMRVLDRQAPTPFPEIALGTLLSLNLRELAGKAALFPLRVAKLARTLLAHVGQVSALDVVLGLAEGLPSGLYSGRGIETYVRRVLHDAGRTDDFRELSRQLLITATDLDSCERVVFGQDGFADVPISTAVRASTALPMVYEPVRVGDRELIDGGILSTTNLDLAVEAGAKLVVVVNPLVPYVNEARRENRAGPRVSDMGFARIGYQTFKLMTYQRLHEIRERWEQRYPGVDFVLIEPDASDELMFSTSVMDYGSRVEIASHGFRSVTVKLANDYDELKAVAARHGIEISATRLRKVVKHFAAVEPEQTARWRKLLEQTTSTLLRQTAAAGGRATRASASR
jgi:predicted acylesterase/phospholipase RssA